jgi:hypothetical protein
MRFARKDKTEDDFTEGGYASQPKEIEERETAFMARWLRLDA